MHDRRHEQAAPEESGPTPGLVGREREQHALARLVNATRSGIGQLVIIGGETGIGKTALVEWMHALARGYGLLVLTAHCYDVSTPPPYGPWLTLLRQFVDSTSRDNPPLTDPAPSLTAGDSPAELFQHVEQVLDEAASASPVILTIEDIHWADSTTIDLLQHVTRGISTRPVLLAVTYRNEEVTPDSPLYRSLPVLARASPAKRLHLHRLDSQAVRSLVRRHFLLPESEQDRLSQYLEERAQGNPLFMLELLQGLTEQRVLAKGDREWILGDLQSIEIPSLVQQLVTARLSSFSSTTRSMLAVAAISGQIVPLDLLEEVNPGTLSELDNALQEAIERRCLRLSPDQQSVQFSHEIVRQAISESIPPMTKRRIHRQIGEVLAGQERPDVEAVAQHLACASDERALVWLTRAAQRAHQLHATESARNRCQQALSLASRIGTSAPPEIYRLDGVARDTQGDFDGALHSLETALRIATDSGDQRARWRTLLDLSAVWSARDYTNARHFVEEAVEVAETLNDQAVLAQSLNRLGNFLANAEESTDAIRMHQRALDIFERIGDEYGTAATLDLIGLIHVLSGNAAKGFQIYGRAIPVLRKLEDRKTLITALVTSAAAEFGAEHALFASNMQHRDPYQRPDRYIQIDEARQLAQDIGWRAAEAFCLTIRSRIAHLFGDLDVALVDGFDGVRIARDSGHPQWHVLSLCSLGMLYQELGIIDPAISLLEEAFNRSQPTGSRFLIGLTTSLLASCSIRAGDNDRASSLLQESFDPSKPPDTTTQRNLWFAMTELHLARGQAGRGIELFDQLEERIPGPDEDRDPRMLLLRGKLLLASNRHAEAQRHLEQAKEISQRFGYLTVLLSILIILRSAYLEQGNVLMASQTRSEGIRIGNELANRLAKADPELSDRFLTEVAARLPERMPFHDDTQRSLAGGTLTRREHEVLQLVALGLTDADVSERLFISRRTVSQHLRSIYRKLDASNRTAAVQIARDLELLDRKSTTNT